MQDGALTLIVRAYMNAIIALVYIYLYRTASIKKK